MTARMKIFIASVFIPAGIGGAVVFVNSLVPTDVELAAAKCRRHEERVAFMMDKGWISRGGAETIFAKVGCGKVPG